MVFHSNTYMLTDILTTDNGQSLNSLENQRHIIISVLFLKACLYTQNSVSSNLRYDKSFAFQSLICYTSYQWILATPAIQRLLRTQNMLCVYATRCVKPPVPHCSFQLKETLMNENIQERNPITSEKSKIGDACFITEFR